MEQALFEILKSAPFRGSRQSQHLLQYIVSQSLEGHSDRLKERVIGAEVFGRAIDYDTNVDPIVRSRAAEVRKRLAQYYVADGKDSRIRIEFSPGSYHATFSDVSKSRFDQAASAQSVTHLQTQAAETTESESLPDNSQIATAKRVHLRSRLLILGIAVIIVMGGVTEYERRPANPVRLFWSAILETPV